jgi:hypothetical protein
MKITAIRTRLVDVPVKRPIASRIRVSSAMTHLSFAKTPSGCQAAEGLHRRGRREGWTVAA